MGKIDLLKKFSKIISTNLKFTMSQSSDYSDHISFGKIQIFDLPELIDIPKIIDLTPELNIQCHVEKNPIDMADNAARDGKIDIVKELYKMGYECTSYGYNRALREGHLEVVKFLNENCKNNYFSNYNIEGTLIHSLNEEIKEYIKDYILKKK